MKRKIKNIAFRADASNKIGTGHLMRCITLALCLKKADTDANIIFVCRYITEAMSHILEKNCFKLKKLEGSTAQKNINDLSHSMWLDVTQEEDAKATIKSFSGQDIDLMVVDNYALDFRWEALLIGRVGKVVVIDDIADRHHDCDMILDQNFYIDMKSRYSDKAPIHSKFLLGPKYALLREEFFAKRKCAGVRNGNVEKIFVNFGGVDVENYTQRVLEALACVEGLKCHVDVVIGKQHPKEVAIVRLCRKLGYVCHIQSNCMADLMLNADMAIGAGGATSLERCALGLPTLIFSIAKNQIEIAKGLEYLGACEYANPFSDISKEAIARKVSELLATPSKLESMSKASMSLVDGLGASRVCKEMKALL